MKRIDEKLSDVARMALEEWGADSQMLMFHEEVGELMSALNKYSRGRVAKREVQDEIADVEIMITQLKILFGKAAVERRKEAKINRLESIINGS